MNRYKVELNKKSGFESEVKIRDFTITIDEPERIGGTNKGPNPVEVLLASLVGCLDFTGTIVAQQMGYELEDFKLDVEGELDPRGVMGKADVPMGLQEICVKVKEVKGIPEEKIPEFLEEVQDRCPVDNTITKGVPVDIEW
ncbi:MAG: OsmC family protein [Candidatus Saliniplasma sp.]